MSLITGSRPNASERSCRRYSLSDPYILAQTEFVALIQLKAFPGDLAAL
jgi:hypothetical protein